MRIERMTREAVPLVADLERRIFSTPWSEQGFFDALAMENVIFLTAFDRGCLLGYCGVYIAADEGEITNVAVAEEYRGRGIAGALLRRLIDEGGRLGATRYILEVRASNSEAIHLYEGLGFLPGGVRRNFYLRPTEDALVMIRR